MGLDQLGVLAVGTLASKEGMHTLSSTPCLPFRPGPGSHCSSLAPQGHLIRAYAMQHVVHKALIRWVAGNLISGHVVHAGNHRHWTAGHNQGRGGLRKQRMCRCLERRTRLRVGVSTFSVTGALQESCAFPGTH